MKTIKINNIEVSAEELRRVIKENPDILKDEVKGRYFFPKEGEKYYSFGIGGSICDDFYRNHSGYALEVSWGVYKTKEDAELARDKQKAIVACWKWAGENAPFEPDWKDLIQQKWSVFYNYINMSIKEWYRYTHDNITLPYFKSKEDAQAFINANKDNLMLLFTK